MEVASRAALVVLKNGLNTQLASDQTGWNAEDASFATAMGIPTFTVPLEPIVRWEVSTSPSALSLPKDQFPFVCVYVNEISNVPNVHDHVEKRSFALIVEIFCKSTLSAQEVHSRTNRTVEAAHKVIVANRTLNNKVRRIFNQPRRAMLSESYRGSPDDHGVDLMWWWQGGRLEYMVEKSSGI